MACNSLIIDIQSTLQPEIAMIPAQPVDTEPIIDMDDTTGSNGGPVSERFSGETDSTEEQQGDDYTHSSTVDKPRSDTARNEGSETPVDNGNTDSNQGRSQY